jgi:hypothetical protein
VPKIIASILHSKIEVFTVSEEEEKKSVLPYPQLETSSGHRVFGSSAVAAFLGR